MIFTALNGEKDNREGFTRGTSSKSAVRFRMPLPVVYAPREGLISSTIGPPLQSSVLLPNTCEAASNDRISVRTSRREKLFPTTFIGIFSCVSSSSCRQRCQLMRRCSSWCLLPNLGLNKTKQTSSETLQANLSLLFQVLYKASVGLYRARSPHSSRCPD